MVPQLEAMSPNNVETELIELNQKLLNGIAAGNYELYESLIDASITCFEPEAVGHLVEGHEFHKYYFDLPTSNNPVNTTMVRPHVRLLGEDAAVVCYARLTQTLDEDGAPTTAFCEETRVWQKVAGLWKNVHVHRSVN